MDRPPTSPGHDFGKIAVKKRLPWLEAPKVSKPEQTEPESTPFPLPGHKILNEADILSLKTLGNDLALRPIGSVPEIRTKVSFEAPTSYSDTSQRPMRRLKSPPIGAQNLNSTASARMFHYASSEYSTTAPSDREPLPRFLPKKDAASYEKLVRHNPNSLSPRPPPIPARKRHHVAALSGLGDSTRSPNSEERRGTRTLKPNPSPYRKQTVPTAQNKRRRCKSCENPFSDSNTVGGLCAGGIPAPMAKTSTLNVLPAHLMAPSSSSASSVQVRTRSPQPKVERISTRTAPLSQAVTGLEKLMDEALSVAKHAAKNGNSAGIANVFDDATAALRRASAVQTDLAAPLKLSSSESMRTYSSDSDVSPQASIRGSRQPSAETVPTAYTKSAKPSVEHMATSEEQTKSYKLHHGRSSLPTEEPLSAAEDSMSPTPPRLYQPHSADSIVRDFAYNGPKTKRRHSIASAERAAYGEAAVYYRDEGQSVAMQPGVRKSIPGVDKALPPLLVSHKRGRAAQGKQERVHRSHSLHHVDRVASIVPARRLRRTEARPDIAPRVVNDAAGDVFGPPVPRSTQSSLTDQRHPGHPGHLSRFLESGYYRLNDVDKHKCNRQASVANDSDAGCVSLKHPRLNHISVKEGEGFNLGKYHKRSPIARDWSVSRKRMTSFIACLNTIFVGLIAGIYAGEVPRIQYQLGDTSHWVIFGNMLFFAGLGLTTLLFWPLPLLHGRRPYTFVAFGIMLPLQLPQALVVAQPFGPGLLYRVGLLLPRALTGMALGFANINFLPTL